MNSTEAFRAAMRRAGLDYAGPIIADGKLHRFKAGEDHERNSWYVLFSGEPPAGAFGCWKRGVKERWCDSFSTLSNADRNRVHQQWMDAQRERARQEKDRQKKAREIAIWILKRSQPLTRHPYLDKKGIQPHGESREYRGAIALPLRDINGVLNSMQFIGADGTKRFLSGGRVAACFYTVAEKEAGPLLLCEGFATGASLYDATGFATICAMNCGNLLAVAKAVRAKWPEREIIVAADNDAWTDNNPGLTAATAAAKAIRAGLAMPNFKDTSSKPTDFNDLAAREGLATVRKQIESAFAPGTVSLLLREREFNPGVEPPPLRAIYTLAGNCIATPGNLATITAAVKTGKTAVLGAMAAAAMPHNDDADLLGFDSSNPKGLALVWFDSEQSPDDFWHSVFRAVRRAGLQKPPAWLHSYCLTGLDYKAAWRCVQEAIRRGADAHGGIHSVLLDGAADFVADVNDPAECNAFVATLHCIGIERDCPIIPVIHFNPGTEKSRGHLGSQLERKAETNLRLDKENGITTISSDKQRRAPIPKGTGPCFTWSEVEDMHVSTETRLSAKEAEKRETLTMLAEDLFSSRPAMRYCDIVATVMERLIVSESTAARKVRELSRLGIPEKSAAGLWIPSKKPDKP